MAVMANEKRLKKLLEDVMMSLLEDDEKDSEEKEYSEDEEIDADRLDDKEFFLHGYESDAPIDEEGQMAKSQLHRIKQISYMLCDMLESGDQLPAWVQDHVSVAHENLGQVFSYMEPKYHMTGSAGNDDDDDWSDEELLNPEELGEAKRGLWANIHARRKAGKRRKRSGEKGYPKTLKIDK